jgi:hypothetical protein
MAALSRIKIFFIGTVMLFGAILAVAALKKRGVPAETPPLTLPSLSREQSVPNTQEIVVHIPQPSGPVTPVAPEPIVPPKSSAPLSATLPDFLEVDHIERLFTLDPSQRLPIVETVSFTSRVPWLKGRPAWVADYASYYETSRHFIARCLNHKADYFSQKITPGARFNVFRKDKELRFHLLIDLSKCRLLFYYSDAGEKFLLKTYAVAVGRSDPSQESGCLTPLGKYSLGSRVAIYKPGTMGIFRDQKAEMIQIFGTRWLPFDQEIEGCTKKAKGFGLHGAPWIPDPVSGQLIEESSKIGQKITDGSIWLSQEDIEEIFSIVLTKPTFVEIVKETHDPRA